MLPRLREKIYNLLSDKLGYLIFLIQELPSTGIWIGAMTIPFFLFIVVFVMTFPASLIGGIVTFVTIHSFYLERVCIVVGGSLFVYSAYYLHKRGGNTLVITGPYKYIRHPQYLGLLLMSVGLGSWSYVIYAVTYGLTFWQIYLSGFFDPIKMWYIEVGLYILVALIEERFLCRKFGKDYKEYQKRTSFMVPIKILSKNRALDILCSVISLSVLLNLSVYISLALF